jgi:hypothetical protein
MPCSALLYDLFDQQTLDEIWLLEVGRRGWITISRNSRIRHEPYGPAASYRRPFACVGGI